MGLRLRVTNKEESGFGKASDRAKAKDHRPQGIPVVVRWEALSVEGEKLDNCSKVIIGHHRLILIRFGFRRAAILRRYQLRLVSPVLTMTIGINADTNKTIG